MSNKGKKFTAAEKHFNEKALKMRQECRQAQLAKDEALAEAKRLREENERLMKENERLRQRNDVLESTLGLTEQELKDLIDASKHQRELAKMFDFVGGRLPHIMPNY